MNLGPNPSHETFPPPSPTLNKVQGIPKMVRKPFMVAHSDPVLPVGVPLQLAYPNELNYGSGKEKVPVYGIPRQPQSTGVPPPVCGIPVQSQYFVPTQFEYQPQHGYTPQVMRSQPYYGGGTPQAPPTYFPQQMSGQQAYVLYAPASNMPHQYALHTHMNQQLPFLETLDLPDLSRLTNDPICIILLGLPFLINFRQIFQSLMVNPVKILTLML